VKSVFFDIDTQIDFLFPAGALYVPGAEKIVPSIVRLNRHASSHAITVVSTTCAHTENDPEFREWPAHCVVDTVGQRKPAATLLDRRLVIPNKTVEFALADAQQVILEKQALDLFTNPNLSRLLETLTADQYVVYGVVTEYCVRCAAMGLLATGKPVSLVTDAVETLNKEDSSRMLREFTSQGGLLATADEICQRG